MLIGLAQSEVEVVEPLPIEFGQATPNIVRPSEAMQWLNAHHEHGPITRHALVVLESIDAIDLAFDTFVCALLDGEVDTSGYPEYNAIVGGVASHWDEATGDMIVRAVVGWGGKGVRGDTDRIGARILGGLLTNVLANQYAMGLTQIERPCRPPAGAASSAPIAGSPRATSARSTARSAACASFAADRTRPTPSPMPTYDYVCGACGHRVEVIHGVHEHGPVECPNCHARAMRKAIVGADGPLQGQRLGEEGPRRGDAHEGGRQGRLERSPARRPPTRAGRVELDSDRRSRVPTRARARARLGSTRAPASGSTSRSGSSSGSSAPSAASAASEGD